MKRRPWHVHVNTHISVACRMVFSFFKHNLKKVRNNLIKSGTKDFHTNKLEIDGKMVLWEHWLQAYQWDVRNHSFPVHQKLTEEHMFPSNQQKMRNGLAEEVLDKNMLHLMEVKHATL